MTSLNANYTEINTKIEPNKNRIFYGKIKTSHKQTLYTRISHTYFNLCLESLGAETFEL